MKKLKIVFSALLTVLLLCACLLPAFAEDGFRFTVDVNQRDTGIAELSEGETALGIDAANPKNNDTNRTTYIFVLCVLLVISVVVLAVSLHKARYKTDEEFAAELARDAKKEQEHETGGTDR